MIRTSSTVGSHPSPGFAIRAIQVRAITRMNDSGSSFLFDEFTAVTDLLERRHDFFQRDRLVVFGADRCQTTGVFHFDGKHARCLIDGQEGLGPSTLAGHALDLDHGASHVGRKSFISTDHEVGE